MADHELEAKDARDMDWTVKGLWLFLLATVSFINNAILIRSN